MDTLFTSDSGHLLGTLVLAEGNLNDVAHSYVLDNSVLFNYNLEKTLSLIQHDDARAHKTRPIKKLLS